MLPLDAVLAVLRNQSRVLDSLRCEVHDLMVTAELKRQLRTRHRLLPMCMGARHLSAWTLLYKYGTDENLLDVATLTRREKALQVSLKGFPPARIG
ncbi:hypothetical protein JG687_00004536 [Phytophthora cactorum]|uniref:Uncharacterized protein n=1 Tax=Phytophthora cactorum TaxID=29920 RepID=A0A8T1UPP1_9STRA|nr:hypothetical protein JG687_00004536 [Phytophthora cactorum]